MAAYTLDRTQAVGSAAVQHGSALARLFSGIKAWNERRQTRNALNRLTDRELADIGILRADIATLGK
ncbi:DUF1127 domain-containing protein [Xinfangfangia sp. D13-10-4-6]|uniref:DUF1127 domain-containing protein n=1 Tax=Pseudogemmobacter hezensis TaxID=2737662 RepID=UPI0015517C73|nr:DUF1127 domain-containing protein [Pseudogemmobacter hezensis]NPD14712.1 DUF1127 domain-containing protein [Pseudogemmobacter hezensis]